MPSATRSILASAVLPLQCHTHSLCRFLIIVIISEDPTAFTTSAFKSSPFFVLQVIFVYCSIYYRLCHFLFPWSRPFSSSSNYRLVSKNHFVAYNGPPLSSCSHITAISEFQLNKIMHGNRLPVALIKHIAEK